MGKDYIYFDDLVFDHVKCSVFDNTQVAPDEGLPLKAILRIYFSRSHITIQGSELMWFLSIIVPQIKDKLNSSLASSPHINLHNLPVTAPGSVSEPTLLSGKEYASSAALNQRTAHTPFPCPSNCEKFFAQTIEIAHCSQMLTYSIGTVAKSSSAGTDRFPID